MAPKYGDFKFPTSFGFRASAGLQTIPQHQRTARRFAKGGKVGGDPNGGALQEVPPTQINEAYGVAGKKVPPGYADGGKVKKAVHKHEKAMHPGKPLTKLKRGGYNRKPMIGG